MNVLILMVDEISVRARAGQAARIERLGGHDAPMVRPQLGCPPAGNR